MNKSFSNPILLLLALWSLMTFWCCGWFVAKFYRHQVYNIIRIFSGSFTIFLVALFVSIDLNYLSNDGSPNGVVGELITKVAVAELDITDDTKIFLGGCIVLFLPQVINFLFAWMLDCLPEDLSDDRMTKRLDPFYLLYMFLVKSFVVCAALTASITITGIYYHWAEVDKPDAIIKGFVLTEELLSFSILILFTLDSINHTILDKKTRNKIKSDIRNLLFSRTKLLFSCAMRRIRTLSEQFNQDPKTDIIPSDKSQS